jgi:hypothetical protein
VKRNSVSDNSRVYGKQKQKKTFQSDLIEVGRDSHSRMCAVSITKCFHMNKKPETKGQKNFNRNYNL